MSDVRIDIIEGARLMEQRGTVVECVRLAIVSGVPPTVTGPGAATQYSDGIFRTVLNDGDMPQPGEVHRFYKNLWLVDRRCVARATDIVQVELVYKPITPTTIQPPQGEPFVLSGGASVEQIETMRTRDGQPIIVEFEGDEQNVTISPFVPRRELQFRRREQSLQPGAITNVYVGKVNSQPWNGPARSWLCTSITFDLVENTNTSPPEYDYSYNFRQSPEGVDPEVWYTDEQGLPPVGLVADVGVKRIPWHPAVDFNNLIVGPAQ